MIRPKRIFACAVFFAVCLTISTVSYAQTPVTKQSEASFDVLLQTVVASNNSTEKSNFSQSLSGIVKKLKSDFLFSDYRLTSTFMQRVSNNGNLELKSAAYETNQDKNYPIFSEWTLNGLQNTLDEKGMETIQVQNFRFGRRIPIQNSNGAVTYEQIGLTTKFSLAKNTPTVVGSLTTARPDELMFLILTVKAAGK